MNTASILLLGEQPQLHVWQFMAMLIGIGVIMSMSMMIFIVRFYKRCGSNEILVVYGKTNEGQPAKCMHGGAIFVVPLLQDYARLSLNPIQVTIRLRDVLPIKSIQSDLPSVFTVAIGTTPELMQNTAVRLLGLTTSEIEKQAATIILGQLRQVVIPKQNEIINYDQSELLTDMKNSLEPALNQIGLVLIDADIPDFTADSC